MAKVANKTKTKAEAQNKRKTSADESHILKTGKPPIADHLRLVLKDYERRCTALHIPIYQPFKKAFIECIEESEAFIKIVFTPDKKYVKSYIEDAKVIALFDEKETREKTKPSTSPKYLLSPLLDAMRANGYMFLEYLYIWGTYIDEGEAAVISAMIGTGRYPVSLLCIFDCLLSAHSLGLIAKSLNADKKMTEVYLDFNYFGDAGCKLLAAGMNDNKTITLLSMRFCGITQISGIHLASILAKTPVKDVFLEGNEIETEGFITIIGPLIDFVWEITENGDPRDLIKKPQPKKSKKKSDKKITAQKYPPVGPFIRKLIIPDCGLHHLHAPQTFGLLLHMLGLLIESSPDIEEIDLWRNCIGNVAALTLLRALEIRKEKNMSPIILQVGPNVNNSVVQKIAKLSKGNKKGKGKGK